MYAVLPLKLWHTWQKHTDFYSSSGSFLVKRKTPTSPNPIIGAETPYKPMSPHALYTTAQPIYVARPANNTINENINLKTLGSSTSFSIQFLGNIKPVLKDF